MLSLSERLVHFLPIKINYFSIIFMTDEMDANLALFMVNLSFYRKKTVLHHQAAYYHNVLYRDLLKHHYDKIK